MNYGDQGEKQAAAIGEQAMKMAAGNSARGTIGEEDRRPFARHDARTATAPVRSDTSLRGLMDRLAKMADIHGAALHGIASQLEDHADRVHGPLAPMGEEAAGTGRDMPYYGDGMLAQVWLMLDNLDEVLHTGGSRVAFQAGRNPTIA